MVKITYEYLGGKLIEDKNGMPHVFDDGSIRNGVYTECWYEGSEEWNCTADEINKRVHLLERSTNCYGNKLYRNIKVNY